MFRGFTDLDEILNLGLPIDPNRSNVQSQGLRLWYPMATPESLPLDRGGYRSDILSAVGDPAFVDRGWEFDTGKNDYFRGPVTPISGAQERTATAWVKRISGQELNGGIIAINPDGAGATGQRWSFRCALGTSALRMEIQGSGYTSSLTIPDDDEWHFVACRFRGTQLQNHRLTLDRASENATGANAVNTNSTYEVQIGSAAGNNVNQIAVGYIRDARLYNRYLTDGELDLRVNLETRWDLIAVPPIFQVKVPAVGGGATPKGPLGMPLHGPFGGPI